MILLRHLEKRFLDLLSGSCFLNIKNTVVVFGSIKISKIVAAQPDAVSDH